MLRFLRNALNWLATECLQPKGTKTLWQYLATECLQPRK